MQINKTELVELIYSIAKQKNIFIKDLEKKAGLSQGALSRVKNGGALPSLEAFTEIAEQLGVSIDFLLNARKSSLSENEQFLISFLDSLISSTTDDKISWTPDAAGSLIYDSNDPIKVVHPLINSIDNYSDEIDGWYHTTEYNSKFADCYCALTGVSYHAELSAMRSSIYVMHTRYSPKEDGLLSGPSINAIEIYIDDQGSLKPLCCSFYTKDEIGRKMFELYDTISSVSSHISLDNSTKDIMKNFINKSKLPF